MRWSTLICAKKILSPTALLVLGAVGCGVQSIPHDGWESTTAVEANLDPELMRRLGEAVTNNRFENLHAVIVTRGGRLVVDAYAPGVDAGELHYVASVTKSVGSLLLGIAMDRGLMPGPSMGGLNLTIADLFPEQFEIVAADPRKRDIRLHHVLSMTAGLAWDEDSYPYDDPRNDWVRVRDADDPVRMILEQDVAAPPGEEFVYNGGMSALVGALLERIPDESPEAFAERELFEPLDISRFEWRDLEGGDIDIAGGLYLRPRDLAKIGQLCLQDGVWNGQQVVSREWLAESTRMRVRNAFGPDYGLHWWGGEHHYQQRSARVFMASGHGGQRLYVIPEFDLVVVVLQQVFNNPMSDANNLSIMSQYVLPAAGGPVAPTDTPPPGREELRKLAGEYRSDRGLFTIELREDALWALAENTPPLRLEPVGPSRFRGTALGLIEVDFVFDVGAAEAAEGGITTFGFTADAFTRMGR